MDDVRRAEPDIKIDLPELPARMAVKGVEFIEIATRGEEAHAFSQALQGMGFRRAGVHIAKQLTLWQQGSIRIIVNEDPSGFAQTFYHAHGTGICDLGLHVASVARTVTRASAMGAAPFSQPIGPGELNIPAIRGVGGSVMHFIDDESGLSDVWEIEFLAEDETGDSKGAGLNRIDHVGQTMDYDEMLSWSLFYTSIFDLKTSPMLDIVDPDGLVRSQSIEAPDGAVRLTLNGAETHRTLAGHFLSDSLGSTVQHVAFATDDIFDTAARLAVTGFEPLPIPENYYGDLATRFNVDDSFVSQLKASNILYDEDDLGRYLQLYGRPDAKGFFFEIVERQEDYNGYGAPNAPFRIAAQKRLIRQKGMPIR